MEQFGETDALLLSVGEVARLCGCSPRTIRRMSDAGRMPRPVKIGALARWEREAILDWIASGCKAVRTPTQRKGEAQ